MLNKRWVHCKQKKICCYGISRLITEHLAKCERAIVSPKNCTTLHHSVFFNTFCNDLLKTFITPKKKPLETTINLMKFVFARCKALNNRYLPFPPTKPNERKIGEDVVSEMRMSLCTNSFMGCSIFPFFFKH